MHKRVKPFIHEFNYSIFNLLLDLDDLPQLSKRYKIISHNRFNLFAFYDKDHGKRNGSSLKEWVVHHAAEKGVDCSKGKIYLFSSPRLLGYVFNPLSIYFCTDKENKLIGILYQVKNTFGDQHGYFHAVSEEQDGFLQHTNKKSFYVSPFISMDAEYFFKIKPPKDKFHLIIEEHEAGSPLLFAEWKGIKHPLTTKTLLKQFFAFPLITLKIIVGIHWEALFIWAKGAKFYRHTPPPSKEVE